MTDPRPRRRPDATALAAVVLVLLAAGAVALGSPARWPVPTGPTTATVPVTRTALACPDLPAPAGGAASVRAGRLARGAVTPLPGAAHGPVVRADGPAAAGLFATRTDSTRRTLGVTGCASPRARWWFTGAGAGLDHASTLVLANPDPGPAVVDVTVLGPDGPVDTVAGHGVLVPPGSGKRLRLADLAPQTDELALAVRAERGRVVAAVDDARRGSATGRRGQEWLPGTAAPGRDLLLAGAPAGAGRRTLLVANPSDSQADVAVRLSGSAGTFTPTGLGPVSVAPGSLRAVDVTDVLARASHGGDVPAVRLRATGPVVASLRTTVAADDASAGAVGALTGPALAPVVPGARATVVLTAGSRGGAAGLTAYDARGRRADGTTLRLGPGATEGWTPPRGAAYLLVRPRGPGAVAGAVGYTGAGVATLPLTALPLHEQRPAVQPGLP